jgi:hypothetical protein
MLYNSQIRSGHCLADLFSSYSPRADATIVDAIVEFRNQTDHHYRHESHGHRCTGGETGLGPADPIVVVQHPNRREFAGWIGGRHLPDDELCSRLGSVQNRTIFLSLVHFSPHFRFIRTEPEQGKSEDRPLLSARRPKIDVQAKGDVCHGYTIQ